jgi:hypothetical protein
MALYSRTDNEAQRRKVGATTELNSVTTDPGQDPADQPQAKVIDGQYIYIDDTEATIPANKARGLTAPGWWKYRTYTDAAGNTRHKAEHLVAFKDAPTTASDTDDRYAADAIVTLTLSTVEDQTTDDEVGEVTFEVVATGTGTKYYQWQYQTATGTKWTNISGETSDTLNLTGLTLSDNGKKYRVKVTSSTGAPEAISNTATLTVTEAEV